MTSTSSKIRVLVVDDSAFVRRAIIKMFEQSAEIQIIDVAADGIMALDLIKKLHPDVVTLDVQMPVLDGLQALERIMNECPVPVLMLSSLTGKGGDKTLKALELGAVDFIDKSSAGGQMDISGLAMELTAKIKIAAKIDLKKLKTVDMTGCVTKAAPLTTRFTNTEIVIIGTSTGGPPALQTILTKIPANYPCPILVVQHMSVGFTAPLAERLDRLCPLRVMEARDGDKLEAGTVYIAPAGRHLKICRRSGNLFAWLDKYPDHVLHMPSVDVLFTSAAGAIGKNCLVFVLTGMGRDGAVGAQDIKKAGGRVVVESEETAIVFGMPKAVMEAVKVDRSAPLYRIADLMLEMIYS
ncbi:MAG: chemotaxis response regulator protein-glutamate methylesterase [Desulfuromonadales bacterium]|nr:chemotaxis response regulator protein-glutamate methylesterase [Desulfuromonadales bacterium]